MAKIYGTPIGGGGTGTNTTLPPLLDNFKAKAKGNISKKGHGEAVNIIDSIESELNGLKLYGKSTQDGAPTPEAPVPIVSAGDSGTITVTVSDGAEQSQTLPISTPTGLHGIPVTSGGNYTDADGQQWICDEIDFARGKYVQRFKMLEFDGTEDWVLASSGTPKKYRWYLIPDNIKKPSANNVVIAMRSTHYLAITASETWRLYQGVSVEIKGKLVIYDENHNTTTEDWKNYLAAQKAAGTPVKVVYELETPVETDIPEETIEAYKSLTTYAPVTNITTDSTPAAGIEIEYASTAMNVELSADKMLESRANELAGAVWVYGDHEPESVNDGTKIQLSRDEVVDSGSTGTESQTVSKTIQWNDEADFFARQFTYNSKKQYQTMLEGALASVIVEGAPEQVTDLVVTGSGGTATLTWVNPTDDPLYHETVVIQKVGSAPTSLTDGTEIYRGTGTTVTASGLVQLEEYYFAVFTIDEAGSHRSPVVSEMYSYDFPAEPTSWTEIETLSDSESWVAPENGWFKFVCAAKCGNGGESAVMWDGGYPGARPPHEYWGLSGGAGGAGGYSESKVSKLKDEIVEITFSNGSISCLDISVTAGGNGKDSPQSSRPGGAGGTAIGGNITNINGEAGAPGVNGGHYSGSSSSISMAAPQGGLRGDGQRGGNGAGITNGNENSPAAGVGAAAYVKIYRGNTNVPAPSTVSTLSLTPRNTSIEASWTNSGDPESVGTILVSNSDHVPVHPTDGTSVDVAEATSYTVTDLPNNKPSYISLFAYNADKTKYSMAKSDVEIPREVTWYDVQEDLKADIANAQEEADYLTKENLTMANAGIMQVEAYCAATSNPPTADSGVFASGVDEWKAGVEYKLNDLFTYQGNMGYVKQPTLTSLDVYPPFSVGTEALYGARPKPDADGIYPYVYNMGIYKGMLVRDDDGMLYRSITGTQERPTELLYHPKYVPTLLEKVEEGGEEAPSEEYPEWVQPTGAHDAYAQGAKVSHNGKKWTSDIAANVWEPGVYGWTEVIE